MRAIATCLLVLAACGVGGFMPSVINVPVVRGLRHDTNPAATPAGSLRTGANCVVKRAGMIESRPGFAKSANTHATIKPNRLLPWRELGTLLAVNADGTVAWWNALATPIKNESAANISMLNAFANHGAAARKNFYINASDGIRKLTSASDTVAELAGFGALPVILTIAANAGTFLATNYYISYRAVVVRTDANGLITRSTSAGSSDAHNSTGGATGTTFNVYVGNDVVAGDVVEIYRIISSSVAAIDNEYYLDQAHTVTAADIAAGFFAVTDDLADADLGAALYTNDSREGVEGSNFRPPSAVDVAFFRDSLFYFYTIGPERFTLKWDAKGAALTGTAAGVGFRTINGTRTNGSAVITMASTTGLKVGMMMNDATSWSGTAPVIIQSIVVNTSVTVNATWGAATDGAPTALTYFDTILIGTSTYYPAAFPSLFMLALNNGYPIARVAASPLYYAYSTESYSNNNIGGSINNIWGFTLVIEERSRGHNQSGVYQIRATHGSDYTPPLAETNVTATNFFKSDTDVGGLYWSKTYEPESVPLVNFARVGSDIGYGLRAIATRDALWLFKQDGVWRLSGVSADSGWRIDPVDPTLHLLQPDAAIVYGDTIYAFTNRGFVSINDAGITDLDANIISNDLEPFIRKFSNINNWKLGNWVATDETNGVVLFGLASATAGTDPASIIYCYNTNTKEFTTWETTTATVDVAGALASAVHMTFEPVSAKLVVAQSAADLAVQRLDTDSPAIVNADYSFAVTVTAVDVTLLTTLGTKVTIAAASGWTPKLGDGISAASGGGLITSVVSTTVFYIYDATALVAGAATAYQAIYSALEFTAQGDPSIDHLWLTENAVFHSLNGVRQFDYSFITDRGAGTGTPPTKTVTFSAPSLAENTVTENPETVRLFVPRASARSPLVYPGFKIHQALSNWRLSGFSLFYENATERVSR